MTDPTCPLFEQTQPESAGTDSRSREERLLEERIVSSPTLDDAAALCRAEIDRLSLVLELCRQMRGKEQNSGDPQSADSEATRLDHIMRTLIERIDQRQDALAELEALVLAARDPDASIH